MPTAQLAINGFGRIGRSALKIALEKNLDVVAINDLSDPLLLVHLLKHDTAYGTYEKEISYQEDFLIVDDKKIKLFSESDPLKLPWKELSIDVVLECTGHFTKESESDVHIKAGAKKVIVSAPTKGDSVQTFVMGVNDSMYLGQNIISNASCTTNCVTPVLKVLHEAFGVEKALMTTVHAMTATQTVVDGPPPGKADLRRARAASYNIVPTSTGAAEATSKTYAQLKDKFDGISIRVPVITGSLVDLVCLLKKDTTVEEITKAFEDASKDSKYKGILMATHEELVSSDIIKSPYSAIVDLELTKVVGGNLVKVCAWYDNEWGYATRLVEMALDISK